MTALTMFSFRPWVRRAGFSIVVVAAAISATLAFALAIFPSTRWGWMGEKFVWIYVGTLWAGGLKVWLGARNPVAEVSDAAITVRPLHLLRPRTIAWESITATEQMLGGDRLILFYDTLRGTRFVALNLNLVKGRRDLLAGIDTRLRAMGFVETVIDRSRLLRRG